MAYDPKRLSKRAAPADSSLGDGLSNPKTHDADGKQLVQSTSGRLSEYVDWCGIPEPPIADLDLQSTERRRAARSRTMRKR